MAVEWEIMRQYVWDHGWRPVKYQEQGRVVLAWEHKETDRFCQDLEDAYHCEHFKQETSK